jgi:secondary thiamine-phosphate synthase enzyme
MNIQKITIKTKEFFDIIDLTEKVEEFLKKISAKNGLVNIYTRHTTVAIKINEHEQGFFDDLKRVVYQDIADPKDNYKHNDTHLRDPKTICPTANGTDCLNGHSHVSQMLLGSASETVPVQEGKMLLGTWQRILMFELDMKKDREVVISFVAN